MLEPDYVVMMKGGPHAGSGWGDIVNWKVGDLLTAGVTFWGYGGSVCHPTRQVQPFAQQASVAVEVAMIPTGSDPGNPPTVSTEWSRDGATWEPLPSGVRVTGSKWALVLDSLELCDEKIDLAEYAVAVGAMAGRSATDYLRHRVDKGCFTRARVSSDGRKHELPVVLRGRLTEPWAVFLR
jgi:hypothetical protein